MGKRPVRETKFVTEWCANCGHENEFRWNPETFGNMAHCAFCGHTLVLCDECLHSSGNPDHRCPPDGGCPASVNNEQKWLHDRLAEAMNLLSQIRDMDMSMLRFTNRGMVILDATVSPSEKGPDKTVDEFMAEVRARHPEM